MTSRRQQHQDRYDHILPFVQEYANDYYGGNPDQGFRHFAFATIFGVGYDIQGNDIVDYTAIDGSDDFEIDGYFIPESDDDSVVHLFQCKHRQPGTSMGSKELAAFLNAPNRILNANEVAACRNEETKTLHDRLISILSRNDSKCSLNLVWATSGTLSQAAKIHERENYPRTITTKIHGNPIEVTVTLECLDLEALCQQHDAQQESEISLYNCDFNFQLEKGSYHQTGADAEYRTLSMTIPVGQIIDVFARHSYKVFRLNPRGPLGNKVNTQIKRTLQNPDERKRFHLLNNGITAICDSWQIDGTTLHVRDFQIINGCQTTVTLWNVRSVVRSDPATLVTVKLTECPSHFALTIAQTTNSQAALRAEDFISTEGTQIRLQEEFKALNPPWFYQIKRGEWGKMLGGQQEKERYRDPAGGYRQLSSKEVAQAVVSFAGYPGEAKDNIRSFLNRESVSSIARESEFSYDGIYSGNIAASQLLLPAVIQRMVRKQVIADKATDEWLDYARFHIIWLIGEVLRNNYGLDGNLFPASRAAAVIAHINDWFGPIYNIAVVTIRNSLQQSNEVGEFTGYREFFRTPSRYRLIQSNLQGGIRFAMSFGDPMANLPA